MSAKIIDYGVVFQIENRIQRKLTPHEIEQIRGMEAIVVETLLDQLLIYTVPLLNFPYDLMPSYVDAIALENEEARINFWDYRFIDSTRKIETTDED